MFQSTTFTLTNSSTATRKLTLEGVFVYNFSNLWVPLPGGQPASQNAGIQHLSIINPIFGPGGSCSITVGIDTMAANDPTRSKWSSSDKASMYFSLGGSNLHIDIQSDGGLSNTGIYGSDPSAVTWPSGISCRGCLGSVGGNITLAVAPGS